ncbi:hypothetical protein ADUPG1_000991, partial [Aduncisulcus paluster]
MSKAILRLTNKVELLEARTYTESKNSLETSSDTASPGKFVKFPIFKTEKEKMSISTHPHEPIFGEKKFISDTETRTQAPAAANPVSDPLDFADPHEQKKLPPPVCGTLPRYPSPLKTHHALASDEFLTEAFASPLTRTGLERKQMTPAMFDARTHTLHSPAVISEVGKPPILEVLSFKAFETFISRYKAYESRGGTRPIHACIPDCVARTVIAYHPDSSKDVFTLVKEEVAPKTLEEFVARLSTYKLYYDNTMTSMHKYNI